MTKKFLTGVRRDRPRKGGGRKSKEVDTFLPLWGDHWNFGSFWDALRVVRSRIETAARVLHFTDGQGGVALMLEDAADELRRLARQAQGEVDGVPSFRRTKEEEDGD